MSRVAEEALAAALANHLRATVREEMKQDIAWIEAYEAEHGSFAEMMRDYQEMLADADAEAV